MDTQNNTIVSTSSDSSTQNVSRMEKLALQLKPVPGVKLTLMESINKDGEVREFLAIDHPEWGTPIALSRGSKSIEEMISSLKENPQWREGLRITIGEYGPYWYLTSSRTSSKQTFDF